MFLDSNAIYNIFNTYFAQGIIINLYEIFYISIFIYFSIDSQYFPNKETFYNFPWKILVHAPGFGWLHIKLWEFSDVSFCLAQNEKSWSTAHGHRIK